MDERWRTAEHMNKSPQELRLGSLVHWENCNPNFKQEILAIFYELWKPYLRATMESDMKAVSIGTKRKAEVLAACLEQMKACFLDARLKKAKLFEAMSIFFERCSRSVANEQNAVGDVVRQCGVCHESDMVLKRKPDGNFMVGCLGFPQCRNVVWLPGSIAEAAVTSNICSSCTPGPVFLIQFKFRRLEIPPNYNVDHLGCVGGCDEILQQLIEICGTGSRILSNNPARGGGAQQTNSRQIACIHCRQYGHSSNDCPSWPSHSPRERSRVMNQPNGGFSIPCDICGTSCMLRTANTANNKGRRFYSCQSQGCNFFVWEDNVSGSGGRSASRPNTTNPLSSYSNSTSLRGRGRSRGGWNRHSASDMTFVSATGDPPMPIPSSSTGRRCFVCGDPSHFANACPNRGM
ncbi:DNA topoisomerase [Bertholletia excelsa]